ncbi:MAG TPA: serine/threonine-protein kinase [Planktothrix sp.]|jgi:tRNA A-37 threonylcarbamoyl transferase component Bud32
MSESEAPAAKVYELKAQVNQLPMQVRLGVMSIGGVLTAIVIFAFVGLIPHEWAFMSILAAIWAVVILKWLSRKVLWIVRHATNISLKMRKDGITLKYGDPDNQNRTEHIPWSELKAIDLPEAGADWVTFFFYQRSPLDLSWTQVQEEIGDLSFINAVHNWAPHAVVHGKLSGFEPKTRQLSYTDLWLHELDVAPAHQLPNFLPDGTLLQDGRYCLLHLLGQGGQGATYEAIDLKDPANHRGVVLKEYIIPAHKGETLRKLSEKKLDSVATLLGRLRHPSIVRLLDHFNEDGRGYLVLEYVHGTTLKQLVATEGPQPDAVVIDMAKQICDILEYLHGLAPPVVHRDLTPDNLMVVIDGSIKVIDFDVAQEMSSARTTTIAGKPRYMPPEQFRGTPTPESDLYALGATMFYLLTGKEPEPMTVCRPQSVKVGVSDELESIVALCTQQEAKWRFASATELKDKLKEAELAREHR